MTKDRRDHRAHHPIPMPPSPPKSSEPWTGKTKPRGSLGRLEALAVQVAAIRGLHKPAMPVKALVIMGADHGVVAEGVSAYPAEVTAQMLLNFVAGGAAINVLARQVGAEVMVVDMGVQAPAARRCRGERGHPPGAAGSGHGQLRCRAGHDPGSDGGGGQHRHPAGDRTGGQGGHLAGHRGDGHRQHHRRPARMCAALLSLPPAEVVGRGTGLDDGGPAPQDPGEIERALAVNRPGSGGSLRRAGQGRRLRNRRPVRGWCWGRRRLRVPVVCDGFIASTAALVAARRGPNVTGFLIGGHRSAKPGHTRVLEALRFAAAAGSGDAPRRGDGRRAGHGAGRCRRPVAGGRWPPSARRA